MFDVPLQSPQAPLHFGQSLGSGHLLTIAAGLHGRIAQIVLAGLDARPHYTLGAHDDIVTNLEVTTHAHQFVTPRRMNDGMTNL